MKNSFNFTNFSRTENDTKTLMFSRGGQYSWKVLGVRICLVNPTIPKPDWGPWPPLGLAYIAAVLQDAGHNVIIIDRESLLYRNAMDWSNVNKDTSDILQRHAPEIVGITATTTLVYDAFFVARLSKEILPEVRVILGGTHATALPVQTMRDCDQIDIVVRGEGEIPMIELASGKALREIKGIVYRAGKEITSSEAQDSYPNVDMLPFPARHLLDMDFYRRPTPHMIRGILLRATSIVASRGCPYRCAFCAGPLISGHKVRFRTPERVVEEIEHLVSRYGIEGVYFADDMFLADRKKVEKICQLMIQRNLNKRITWGIQARVNVVDKDILNLLKRAGLVQIEYGFESGSQKILDLMRKGTTVEQNYRAARLTRQIGLRFLANIIVGMLTEKREDIDRSLRFLVDTKPDVIGFYKLIPIPGTEIYYALEKLGNLSNDWTIYNVSNLEQNLTDIPREEFDEVFNRFINDYVRPRNIFSSMRFFLRNISLRKVRNLIEYMRSVKVPSETEQELYKQLFLSAYRLFKFHVKLLNSNQKLGRR